jgi:hypothetical protein
MAVGLTIAGIILLGALASHYRDNYYHALENKIQVEKQLASAQATITTLQTQDAKNRALMAVQQQQEQKLRQQADAQQRKLRNAIKNDECANSVMPSAVLDLLRSTAGSAAIRGASAT